MASGYRLSSQRGIAGVMRRAPISANHRLAIKPYNGQLSDGRVDPVGCPKALL